MWTLLFWMPNSISKSTICNFIANKRTLASKNRKENIDYPYRPDCLEIYHPPDQRTITVHNANTYPHHPPPPPSTTALLLWMTKTGHDV